MTNQQRLYRDLAWLWPIISPPEDYVEESERFAGLILDYAQGPVKTLLHLGCGGGHNDHTFKRHFQVTGVDISEGMLEHARRLNPDATYHLADMRSVRLGRAFDAVAALDSINYVLTLDDLRAVLRNAFEHLRPGGVFLTYAEETRERFRQDKTVGSTYIAPGLHVTFIENMYDPDPEDSTYEVTFVYLIRRDGRLTVESDRHLCGVFAFDAWISALTETGFTVRHFECSGPDWGPLAVFVGLKGPLQ